MLKKKGSTKIETLFAQLNSVDKTENQKRKTKENISKIEAIKEAIITEEADASLDLDPELIKRCRDELQLNMNLHDISRYDYEKIRDDYLHLTNEEFDLQFFKGQIAKSFPVFCNVVNGLYKDTNTTVMHINNHLYKKLNDKLETIRNKDILILLPRSCMKSTFWIQLRSAWTYLHYCVVYNNMPPLILIGETQVNAEKILENVKAIFEHPIINFLFKKYLVIKKSNQKILSFYTPEGVTNRNPDFSFFADAITGKLAGKRARVVFCDDILSFQTPEKTLPKIASAYRSLLNLSENSKIKYNDALGDFRIITAATHYYYNTIYTDLEKDKEAYTIKIPAVENGIYNFPDILPENVLDLRIKSLAAFEYNSQYLLKPQNPSEKSAICNTDLPEYQSPTKKIKYNLIICDPAISYTNESSRLVIMHVMIDVENNIYVDNIYTDIGKNVNDLLNILIKWQDTYKADFLIETIAYQKAIAQFLNDYRLKNQLIFNVYEHTHHINKRVHYHQTLAPFLNNRKVFIKEECRELKLQCFGMSELEDQIDALSFISTFKLNLDLSYITNEIEKEEIDINMVRKWYAERDRKNIKNSYLSNNVSFDYLK